MRVNKFYVLIGVSIALAIFGLIFSLWRPAFLKDGEKAKTETPVQTSGDLKTYTNDKYGFSFDYPVGYLLAETGSAGASTPYYVTLIPQDHKGAPAGEGPPTISINIYPGQTSAGKWINDNPESNIKLDGSAVKPITINGMTALTYGWKGGLYPGEAVVFENKGNVIAVLGTYLTPTDPIRNDLQAVINSIRINK